MDNPQMVKDIDFGALTQPITLSELRTYHRYARVPWWRQVWTIGTLMFLLIGASSYFGFNILPKIAPTTPEFISWIIGGAGIFYLLMFFGWARMYMRAARIARFARFNGFSFQPTVKGVRREGSAFRFHATSIERDLLHGQYNGRDFAMGKRYTAGNEEKTVIQMPFTFVELELPKKVPHIILKNRRSRIIPLAGLGLGKTRKLELEGNFHKTFSLYCPSDYERDALYIFTPDVMAAVLDNAGHAEIELIGDRLYLYLKRSTRMDDPETMARTMQLVDVLLKRFTKQTTRYKDDTVSGAQKEAGAAVSLRGRKMHINESFSWLKVIWIGMIILTSAAFMAVPYVIGLMNQ